MEGIQSCGERVALIVVVSQPKIRQHILV